MKKPKLKPNTKYCVECEGELVVDIDNENCHVDLYVCIRNLQANIAVIQSKYEDALDNYEGWNNVE